MEFVVLDVPFVRRFLAKPRELQIADEAVVVVIVVQNGTACGGSILQKNMCEKKMQDTKITKKKRICAVIMNRCGL